MVSKLAQFNANPTMTHWKAGLHVLYYSHNQNSVCFTDFEHPHMKEPLKPLFHQELHQTMLNLTYSALERSIKRHRTPMPKSNSCPGKQSSLGTRYVSKTMSHCQRRRRMEKSGEGSRAHTERGQVRYPRQVDSSVQEEERNGNCDC